MGFLKTKANMIEKKPPYEFRGPTAHEIKSEAELTKMKAWPYGNFPDMENEKTPTDDLSAGMYRIRVEGACVPFSPEYREKAEAFVAALFDEIFEKKG